MRRMGFVMAVILCMAVPTPAILAEGQTREGGASLTIVSPTDEGGLAIVSKDKEGKPGTRDEEIVQPDDTPRKARLAVVPAIYSQNVRSKFTRELYEEFGISDPSVLENPGYTRYLVDALTNCRKFDVLEREDLRDVIKEIDFGDSDYAYPAKVVRMGGMLNADYVVIPEINFIHLLEYRKQIPYVGMSRKTYEGKISSSVRVVDVKTSRVVSSSFSEQTLKKIESDRDRFQSSKILSFIGDLYAKSAEDAAAEIISVAYPIKIMLVSGDTVTLNRGQGAIEVGEVLDVYKPGQVMVDPDTKETLGYDEELVGKVEVTEVRARVSKAKIIEGADKIEKLDIVRRRSEVQKADSPPAPRLD